MSAEGELKGAADAHKQFERKLSKAAKQIRAEAKGRICGDCAFWCRGDCPHVMGSMDGYPTYHPPDAVACKRWERAPRRASLPRHPPPDRHP